MAQPPVHSLADEIDALTFDVFGTVVDWRSSVEARLKVEAEMKTASSDVPAELRSQVQGLTEADWAKFATQWRASYHNFTHSFRKGETEWKDVDAHHYESLVTLLDEWQLKGLYTDDEVMALSRVWHFLTPWPDASQGLHALGTKFTTATLSNGNQALLKDLNAFGQLGFREIISAADFGAYKPSSDVYKGAATTLDVPVGRIAMVAAHLGDLDAARSFGMKTIYVERPGEEAWQPTEARHQQARDWVDIWFAHDQGGFVEVARRLGISVGAGEAPN